MAGVLEGVKAPTKADAALEATDANADNALSLVAGLAASMVFFLKVSFNLTKRVSGT